MPIRLPDLPYPTDALEPHMSKRTLEYHHGKHHAGYVKKLNELIESTPYSEMSLRKIIREADKLMDAAVFNNAAQAFNHELFWNSLSPTGKSRPAGELAKAIERDFGSLDKLKQEFRFSAVTLFGSGWAWLVSDSGRLRLVTTGNAGTPLQQGLEPLIALDVWEHAYYLDVQNDRAAYLDAFLDELVDWSAASDRYDALQETGQPLNPIIKESNIMNEKDAYEQRQQARLDEWAAEIDKLKAKAERADADAKIKLIEDINSAETMRKKIEDQLEDLQSSSDDAWTDIKRGLDQATTSLGKSLRSAASRFA